MDLRQLTHEALVAAVAGHFVGPEGMSAREVRSHSSSTSPASSAATGLAPLPRASSRGTDAGTRSARSTAGVA